MAALTLHPLSGIGWPRRLAIAVRSMFSRRQLLRLTGMPVVVLEGRVYAVRPVSLGVARDLVPALLRCSRRFAAWEIDESLYDDMVKVLSLGLRTSPREVECLTVPLWSLGSVIEQIATVNGMPVMEAGGAGLGELLRALTKSTGTDSLPGSSVQPAGNGSTLNNA